MQTTGYSRYVRIGQGGQELQLCEKPVRRHFALKDAVAAVQHALCAACVDARLKLRSKAGQGTTEYAILVGVLVVIAILAIALFRPKLQELWDAIANGINSL